MLGEELDGELDGELGRESDRTRNIEQAAKCPVNGLSVGKGIEKKTELIDGILAGEFASVQVNCLNLML